ncbi:hypothetical protein FRC00_004419, partial [Tulasnella sp. 408]
EDYPALVWRFTAGSPRYSVDLVKSDYTLKSTSPLDSFSKVPTVGRIAKGELSSRNSIGELSEGGYNVIALNPANFNNGTEIPNGSYKLLLRALKITGDPKKNGDYEQWLSPQPKPTSSASRTHAASAATKQNAAASAVVSVPAAKRRERISNSKRSSAKKSDGPSSATRGSETGRILGDVDYVDLIYGSRKKAQEEARKASRL